jgi:hypothetical protein
LNSFLSHWAIETASLASKLVNNCWANNASMSQNILKHGLTLLRFKWFYWGVCLTKVIGLN